MADILKKSRNYFKATGVVYEMWGFKKGVGRVPLSAEPCVVEIREDGKPTGEKRKAQRIAGGISIKTQYGVMEFKLMFTSIRSDGEETKNWRMAEEILNLVPVIGGDDKDADPSYVTLSGSVSVYDYKGKDGNIHSSIQWNANKVARVTEDEPSGCDFTGVGYVQRVYPEMRGDEETGRMMTDIFLADNSGRVFPMTLIGEQKSAEQEVAEETKDLMSAAQYIEEEVERGMTLDFTAARVMRHVGNRRKAARRVFGKSTQDMSSGFDVEELLITEGGEIEQPDELEDDDGNPIEDKSGWMNPAIVKKAITARNAMLEELANADDEAKTETKPKPKATAKPTKKPKKVDPFDDDDDPFGDF